jgi:hypothetical protein
MADCRWLRPELVGQFEFVEWTPDNHLRHSRFVGLRENKKAKDVNGNNQLRIWNVLRLNKTPAQIFSRHLVRIKLIQEIQHDLDGVRDADQKIRFLSQSYILHLVAE